MRDLKKIAKNYFDTTFFRDFICVIPFAFLFKPVFVQSKLFFFIKVTRILKGLEVFNISIIMDSIKDN